MKSGSYTCPTWYGGDDEPEHNPRGPNRELHRRLPVPAHRRSGLADLNERLPTPVPLDRFRPNLVFSGGPAYDDDQWASFQIGGVPFRAVKGLPPLRADDHRPANRRQNPTGRAPAHPGQLPRHRQQRGVRARTLGRGPATATCAWAMRSGARAAR
ncbi:MAG: MOSC domain-containing protein [Hymenobacter sp.]